MDLAISDINGNYTVSSSQPDTRQIAIKLNLIYEGACFGKCLFSFNVIDAIAANLKNIPILADDKSCAVGVIPEGAKCRWEKILIDGVWRNYFQVDAFLWKKSEEKLPIFTQNSSEFYGIEIKLDVQTSADDETAVESFEISELRLLPTNVKVSDFTVTDRYGALPKRKGGMKYGR